jgi:type I restriction enzyme S subunit
MSNSQLPSSWALPILAAVADVSSGIGFPNEFQGNATGDLPFCKVSDISIAVQKTNGVLGKANHYVSYATAAKLKGHPLNVGSTVFAKIGEAVRLNRRAIVSTPCLIDNNVMAVKARFDVMDGYLHYFLTTVDLGEYARSTTVPALRKGDVENLLFPLAPQAEQTRITNQLDTLLTRIQACNDRFDAIPALLKRFRQAILDAALNGALLEMDSESAAESEVPKVPISAIASVGTGSTPLRSNSQFFASTGTPWVTSSATSNAVIVSANEFVTPAAVSAHRLKLYPKGTLLVAMYSEGKTRGQVAELGIEATINQACAAVVVDKKKALTAYVKLALQANYLSMRELAEGGNQPNLNLSKVKEFEIPLPTLAVQTKIVGRVETFFTLADRIEARCTAARTQARRLTPLVLAKAFRGELVAQDPQDEPASVLLQRITAAAAQPAKTPTLRGQPRTRKSESQPLPLATQANWAELPDGAWAAPADTEGHTSVVFLAAVLKAWGRPMSPMQARLASLLCQQPRLFTAVLPADQAVQWCRLVGAAAEPLPAQVASFQPATNSQWRRALAGMRARGELVESGSGPQETWALGPGAVHIETVGWPDGRAGRVVAHLQSCGLEAILPILEPELREFVYAKAA